MTAKGPSYRMMSDDRLVQLGGVVSAGLDSKKDESEKENKQKDMDVASIHQTTETADGDGDGDGDGNGNGDGGGGMRLTGAGAKPEKARKVEVQSKKENYTRRLDAEVSIGVSAALIGGFSLTLLGESNGMDTVTQWIFVMSSVICGAMGLYCVVMTSMIYWGGQHVLSASQPTVEAENVLFKHFWDSWAVRFTRTMSRLAFQLTVPCFFVAVTAWIWRSTANVGIVIAVSVVFILTAIFLVVFIRAIVSRTRSGHLQVMA